MTCLRKFFKLVPNDEIPVVTNGIPSNHVDKKYQTWPRNKPFAC